MTIKHNCIKCKQQLCIIVYFANLFQHIHQNDFKEDFIFSQTRGIEIFDKLMEFLQTSRMIVSDFLPYALMEPPLCWGVAPHITNTHCMIHWEALAVCQSQWIEHTVVTQFVFDHGIWSSRITLLYKSAVVVKRKRIESFSRIDCGNTRVLGGTLEISMGRRYHWWIMVFLAVLSLRHFSKFNPLNLSLQGKQANIMEFVDKLTAFQQMIELWLRKLERENISMFTLACKHLDEY